MAPLQRRGLEFGETTANGFSTIDQFFVHEDKMATGRLYGTLVPEPEEVDADAEVDPSGGLEDLVADLAVSLAGS